MRSIEPCNAVSDKIFVQRKGSQVKWHRIGIEWVAALGRVLRKSVAGEPWINNGGDRYLRSKLRRRV